MKTKCNFSVWGSRRTDGGDGGGGWIRGGVEERTQRVSGAEEAAGFRGGFLDSL